MLFTVKFENSKVFQELIREMDVELAPSASWRCSGPEQIDVSYNC